MVTGYAGGISNSMSFYTDRAKDAKMSTITLDDLYSEYHQLINNVNSNIWTPHNNFNLQGDWRYHQFPTYTFGLGSMTTLGEANAISYSYVRVYESVMKTISGNLSGGIGYNYDNHWNISVAENPESVTYKELNKYDFAKQSISSGFTLNFQYDSRLNFNNPESGAYLNLQIRDNAKIAGSDNDWQSLIFDGREYISLSKSNGNVLAFWTYDCITLNGKPPYLDLPALGFDAWDKTGRGYVQGRFRGMDMIYGETEFRFRLTENGVLGGVLFTNASTFPEWSSNKFERINPGNGMGIRIRLNKFSASNLCIDYGIGTGGSRGIAFNLMKFSNI